MPKSKDKKKSRKRSLDSSEKIHITTEKNGSQNDGIEMSKKLAKKFKTTKTGLSRAPRSINNCNEPRICGNGKPMPSLAELEKMFNDSDDEQEETIKPGESKRTRSPQNCSKNSVKSEVMSKETMNQIANKVLNIISNLPTESILIEDNVPPDPVIPVKKRKKSDVPYIVGCKDRPQVIKKSKVTFGSGDPTYGISSETNGFDDENECPKKRKRGVKMNLSKSIFNAKTDEILDMLKTNDNDSNSNTSTDSNQTVPYEYMKSPSRARSFSPLPSTSKDSETFLKNDKRFNETYEVSNESSQDNDVLLVETPYETITVDEKPLDPPKINETEEDSDPVQFVETNPNNINKSPVFCPSDDDDMYSSIDFEMNYSKSDTCEVIDVDDVLAENQSILAKYRNKPMIETITLIDSSDIPEEVPVDIHQESNTSNLNEPCSSIQNKTQQTNECVEVSGNTISTAHSLTNVIPTRSEIMKDMVANFFKNRQCKRNQYKTRNKMPTVDLTNTSVRQALEKTMSKIRRKFPQTPIQPPIEPNEIINLDGTSLHSHQPIIIHDSVSNVSTPGAVCHQPILLNNSVIVLSSSIEGSPRPTQARFEDFIRNTQTCPCYNTSTPVHQMRQTRGRGRGRGMTRAYAASVQAVPSPSSTRGRRKKANAPVLQTPSPNAHLPVPPPTLSNVLVDPRTSSTTVAQPITMNTPVPNLSPPQTARKTLGDCPICMEDLSNRPIASTQCGHLFCVKCIQAAVKANGKRCPNCRKTLKGVGYHQIFI